VGALGQNSRRALLPDPGRAAQAARLRSRADPPRAGAHAVEGAGRGFDGDAGRVPRRQHQGQAARLARRGAKDHRPAEQPMSAPRLLGLLALVSAGCGEVAFSAHARDNQVDDLRRALRASAAPPPSGRAIAYLVTSAAASERELVGFDLDAGKILWREKAEVR